MAIVHLGIDFGTEFIKAAYAHPETGDKYSIRFPETEDGYLPSVISPGVSQDSLNLCKDARSGREMRFSKVLAASEVDPRFVHDKYRQHLKEFGDIRPPVAAAAIIAYAVRLAERIVRTELRDQYRPDELHFIPHVCIPVDYLENNPVKTLFEKILALAERFLEEEGNALDEGVFGTEALQEGGRALESMKYSPENNRIQYRPEIVAELQSYIHSLEKQRGIPHAVYDIGGGTTEITIFTIDPNNLVLILETKIIPQGTVLTGNAAANFNQVFDRTQNVWAIAQARHRHDYQTFWRNVRVFLSGGGSLIPGIDRPFSRTWDDVTGLYNRRYRCELQFPQPKDFLGENFNRMCVAYGLAMDTEPDVLFPNEAETAAKRRPAKRYPLNYFNPPPLPGNPWL